MTPATIRSGHAVPVAQTPLAATITATLPMASLRLRKQTGRTFASPLRYLSRSMTLIAMTTRSTRLQNAERPSNFEPLSQHPPAISDAIPHFHLASEEHKRSSC